MVICLALFWTCCVPMQTNCLGLCCEFTWQQGKGMAISEAWLASQGHHSGFWVSGSNICSQFQFKTSCLCLNGDSGVTFTSAFICINFKGHRLFYLKLNVSHWPQVHVVLKSSNHWIMLIHSYSLFSFHVITSSDKHNKIYLFNSLVSVYILNSLWDTFNKVCF